MGIMTVLGYEKKKKNQPSEQARELSLEKRKQNKKLRELEHKEEMLEIEERILDKQDAVTRLDNELNGSDDDDDYMKPEDKLFSKLIDRAFPDKAPIGQSTVAAIEPTDEEIRQKLNSLPPMYIKAAKDMSDDQVIQYIKNQLPNVTEVVAERILKILRAEY